MQVANPVVDHLFRHQAGQMVSTLTRIFGPRHVDLAEEVVQDALVRALELWPHGGVPENPGGWLMQVAKNRALDLIRRDARLRDKMPEIERSLPPASEAASLMDDQLAMMFLCCHPALTREARIALTLKTVGGFSVAEIASAFLTQETAIAQRIVRAKRQIRDQLLSFEMPADAGLEERLDSVLEVLYLMFNEGYSAHSGENLIRADLCDEAIRLCLLVVETRAGDTPKTHALAALLLLQHARTPARTSDAGDLLQLAEQDRSRWDRSRIQQGLLHLSRAAEGAVVTPYHLQAGIAAAHTTAPTYEVTDWPYIAGLYDQLYEANPTPVIALNRAVALSRFLGPRAAIEQLAMIEHHPALARYHLLHAVLAELWREAGDFEQAGVCYRAALECDCAEPERRFLEARLRQVE